MMPIFLQEQNMTADEEIQNGESRILEFKKELPEENHKWLKSIVAFANGAGGKILVGVDDSRKIPGIAPEKDIFELKDGIADAIGQGCEPQVMFDVSAGRRFRKAVFRFQ